METDYRKLCIEIFGTDDVSELKRIAGRLKPGRKKALTDSDILKACEMQKSGVSLNAIAASFGISRQTLSKNLNNMDGNYSIRLDYMFRQKVCTEIFVDFINKKIRAINRTSDVLHCAFGSVAEPTWDDFEYFLEERCFPQSRGNKKDLLRRLGIESYDPLRIIEITNGRTPDDCQYINITNLKGKRP